MPFAQPLEDTDCPHCGGDVYWWSEDETEKTIEVYATCHDCGREFPKRFVDKSEDTSGSRLREIAAEQVR